MVSPPLPTWLALAEGGPVAALGAIVGPRTLQSTADPAVFADLLRSVRPRIAIVGTPPAGTRELALALDERRRRPLMRVVLISPPEP